MSENQTTQKPPEAKSKPQQTPAQRSAFGKLLQRFNGRIFTYRDDQAVVHRRRFHIEGKGRYKRYFVTEE